MKYLITGGAGFIGSYLCEKLIARNDQVTVFHNLSTGSLDNLVRNKNKIQLELGNILDNEAINKLVSECDYVVHMAAALGVFNIVNKPLESLKINLHGSQLVLAACDRYRKPVLIASTSEVYGKNNKVPLNEGDDRIIEIACLEIINKKQIQPNGEKPRSLHPL